MKIMSLIYYAVASAILASCFQLTASFKNNAYLLQDHRSYSLVISVTNQNGFKSGGNDSQIFTVQAPKYHRVMIVIQQLYLWPDIDKDFQSYLQFIDSDGTVSPKIYGNIDPDESELTPQYLTGPRSFASTEGTASLVFINLKPDHVISSKNERRVYAKVAFTAFRDTCSYRSIPPLSSNVTIIRRPSRNELIYRSCTTSSASGKNCIAAELFCDDVSVINCAETEANSFGQDEAYKNCDDRKSGRRTYTTSDQPNADGTEDTSTSKKKSGDLLKTLIVDQDYDEYFTELFKSVIIGFLGLCTTCILIAFVVTMFCLKQSASNGAH